MRVDIAVSYALEFCGDVWMVLARNANAFYGRYEPEDTSRNLHEAVSSSMKALAAAYGSFLAAPER
jgi:hypothetical protein